MKTISELAQPPKTPDLQRDQGARPSDLDTAIIAPRYCAEFSGLRAI